MKYYKICKHCIFIIYMVNLYEMAKSIIAQILKKLIVGGITNGKCTRKS